MKLPVDYMLGNGCIVPPRELSQRRTPPERSRLLAFIAGLAVGVVLPFLVWGPR